MTEEISTYRTAADGRDLLYRELVEQLTIDEGADWLEEVLDGYSCLVSANSARRAIFLQDQEYEKDRQEVLHALEIWQELLQLGNEVSDLPGYCFGKADEQEAVLRNNLLGVMEAIKPVEESYRGLALFFENAESEQLSNVSFVNCDISQLSDLTLSLFLIISAKS
ncbi:hypothetical protein MKP07_34605 [Niabella hibiscisoli]|nr:hypothetical protein [Niabella hibiscisoli]MCH5720977.1 hypothetical protein [Niabella hibiscisoli]